MLSSISWQHYLAAVVIITVLYYLYVVHRFYQTEIGRIFNRKKQLSDLFAGVKPAPFSVMGKAKLDNGVEISEMEELYFASSSPDDAEVPNPSTSPSSGDTSVEPEKELELEAGNLMEAFQDIDNKPEFLALLKILIYSYKKFEGDIDLSSVLKRIIERSKEKLQFSISMTDLVSTLLQ